MASLTRLSPSTRLTIRRGAPTLRMIAVAATGSVGETIAPSAKASAQLKPSTSWAMTPTIAVVASTSPIAVIEIARRSVLKARRSLKKAEE